MTGYEGSAVIGSGLGLMKGVTGVTIAICNRINAYAKSLVSLIHNLYLHLAA